MSQRKDWSRPIGDIIADIRKEWEIFAWGRQVTGRKTNITFDTAGEQSLAEKFGWFRRDGQVQAPHSIEHDREPNRDRNAERGIDL